MNLYPLTESQLGMFLEWNSDRTSAQYTICFAYTLPKSTDIDRLERAYATFFDAYPVFRTRFVEQDGEILQYSDPAVKIAFTRSEMSESDAARYETTFPHGFDIFSDPLVRGEIISTPSDYRLILEFAHIITDGSALSVMCNAVSALYNGGPLPAESGAFSDYARAERASFDSDDYRAAAEAAKARFSGRSMTIPAPSVPAPVPPSVSISTTPTSQLPNLPTSQPPNSPTSQLPNLPTSQLPNSPTSQLPNSPTPYLFASTTLPRKGVDAFCRAAGVSTNLFFSGVFARTLALFANEQDVAFHTINHGRRDPALRTTQGFLVKTVPVFGELRGDRPLADYFRSFKLHRAGVYPFTHFCRDLGITPGWGFIYQEATIDVDLKIENERPSARWLMSGGAGQLPSVQIHGTPMDYNLVITALPGRYSAEYLQSFIARCAIVAANFAASDPAAPLASVSTLTDAERTSVLAMSKGEDLDYDASKTFVDLFTATAASRPDAVAVVDAATSLTYGELASRSDALAAELAANGLLPGGFAGVMLPRTVDFAVAMIAVQKCGAGYVPMDSEYPADRLAYMLSDSASPVLVTTRSLFASKKIDYSGHVVFIEGETTKSTKNTKSSETGRSACFENFADSVVPQKKEELKSLAKPSTPAYMIYTSGSTGKPKGVVLPNRALTAMLAWFIRDCGLRPGKKNLSITSFSFDASVPDLFPPLAAGGELHILSEELRKDLEGVHDYAVKVGATGLTTSTQLGLALVNTYPDLPLEYMMLGGEKMVPFAKTPVRMLNGYGPTEFAVCSSYHEVDQTKSYDIPIGRAVANTWSFVVDKLGQLVPAGMIGELALAGPQIADGYWHLPEKTQSVFVDCLIFGLSDCNSGNQKILNQKIKQFSRMYRTGDLARYNAEGELAFEGRIDFQVKLRGFRIEIGEIEHAAASFPGVGAVAAEVKEVAGAKHLVLYYEGHVDAQALKAKMSETLTGYMVPDFFVAMDALPLTPNGKIDRRRLPAPEADDEPIVPPETDAERRIFAVVAEVLKTDSFGVTHDFDRLGLTSLGAMSLMAKLKRSCGLAVSMRDLVSHPTVRSLASLNSPSTVPLAPSRARAESPNSIPVRSLASPNPNTQTPSSRTYPMTENQRGIYSDWLRNPDALQYNVPAAFKFPGVDPAKLAAAAEQVFAAHPAFGTRFAEQGGEIVQVRNDGFRVSVAVERVASEPDAAFFTSRMKPFRPEGDDLARGTVFASPSAAWLFIDIHHTVFDGFSVGIFLTELMSALKGEAPAGEEYTVFDAALDERGYLGSDLVEEDDKWFARYLEDAESTAYATSASGADGRPGEAGRVRSRVAAPSIASAARAAGVTASDWFLTAFTELLKRVGREEDVLINFVTAGRGNVDTHGSVGMFVKTLPLRGIKGAPTFAAAAARMHESVRDLLDRERHSFVRLSERLGVRPDILFAFEGGIFDLPDGIELVSPGTGTVKAPLSVIVTPGKDDFELVLEYDRSMYSAADMEMLVRLFANLSETAARRDPATKLTDLPLLSEAEADEVLALSTGDELDYDATKTVVNLIHANVIARPFATAVVDCEESITYGELWDRSDALAAELASLGVRPGGFVGLMLPRRLGFVVAFLAVQKCGAGYVPMDSEYPDDRLAYMLENSEAPALITTRSLFSSKKIDYSGHVVFIEEKLKCEVEERNLKSTVRLTTSTSTSLATPSTPAYMIYTSGSTGKPKGVVLPHRALRHFCAWVVPLYGLRPGVKVVTHPSFSFDASVMDLFPTLAAGAELHIYSEELRKDLAGMRDYIVRNGINGGTMSTQIGMTLLDTYPDLPLTYLCVGGEKLMPIQKTNVKIFNGYGPTEFTVCSSAQVVDQSLEGDIPIGRAAPGTMSLIVDRYGHLLPRGFAGELALAGPQIADGYWHLPEKTQSVFVDCLISGASRLSMPPELPNSPTSQLPNSPTPQHLSRMYRTGDLARYNSSGTLDYMGRIDFQVKLRGFRIEIGEIEHRASTYPGVKGVAAEVREVSGAKHLVLYYGSEAPLDEAALKAHLAESLTDYMVPDYYVRMDPMPMTPNGKINRKLLPTPAGEAAAEAEYVEPVTDAERGIASVYAQVLKLERFGATNDFFASGGTSLIGIKAVVALQKAGFDVQYGDIFKYKTPRTLAAFLTGTPIPSSALSDSSSTRTARASRAHGETSGGSSSGANALVDASSFDYGDYDYTEIDKLLMATPTELFEGFRRHSLGDVLLCGATGYLGIHVLRHLLETTDSTVYALVRSKRGVGAEKRLDSQYVYYFGERIPRRFRDRLAFVEGDITSLSPSPSTSTPTSTSTSLPPVSTVINCAALVKHYVADDLMDRINVGGVENLIAWCEQSGARLVHMSTYSVGGMIRRDSAAVLDERHLYVGQESDNDYVRTKFLAERAVLAATAAGRIRGKVMRLGNLMGRESDGEFQMNVSANAFVNSLKSYRALGAYPLEELVRRIEMSPIDRVAEAVCLLATTPDGMCVFHPYNCYPLDMGAVVGAMNRNGFNVDGVSAKEFAARVDALRNDPEKAAELQGILHYAGHLFKDRRITPAPNDWTTTVLYRLGFRWKPAEDGYLASFLSMLDGLAVFD